MSQISQNLTNSYENEVIREKMEEIDEMRELQSEYESDAEYGGYADDGEIQMFIELDQTAKEIGDKLNLSYIDYDSIISFYRAVMIRIEGKEHFKNEMTYMVGLFDKIYI